MESQPFPVPVGGLPLEGELRMRWCVRAADEADKKVLATMAAARAARAQASMKCARLARAGSPNLVVSSQTFVPRWTVMQDHDAFPGQDVGRPLDMSQIGKAKMVCEAKGLGGMVFWGGRCYVRPHGSPDILRNGAQKQVGSHLFLRPTSSSPAAQALLGQDTCASRSLCARIRVAVIATQDEFDETSLFDLGMVSNTGNGRRYAAQALLRSIEEADSLDLVALLVYDWKNVEGAEDSEWPMPVEGPEQITVAIRGGTPVTGWRGTFPQLLGSVAGELHVDIAISIQARSTSLELLHHGIVAKEYVVMGHDYNLPYGPWGMEVDANLIPKHHQRLEAERTTMFCTSRHLADYITRFSEGRVQTRLCYCADYGYFDSSNGPSGFPPPICDTGECVVFISPCPAKGLPILLRLAVMLSHVRFLCVTTSWTKSIHEVQLRLHSNIEVCPGSDDIDSIYRRAAVLLMPSLWQESFGLVAVEAQLRGIPVVSTDAYGLSEANFTPELRIANVKLVHDSRTREMLRNTTLAEAERALPPLRPGHDSTEENVHGARVKMAHTIVATEEEAAGFVEVLMSLMSEPSRRRSLGSFARERAIAHVEGRRGEFGRLLRQLVSKREHV